MGSLRVIAGTARGRRLRSVPGDSTRPITDRTKEALFNIIGGDIQGASFLDMFAGTGCVGIEALSRGARQAFFIEKDKMAVDTIRANLAVTGLGSAAKVFHQDAFVFIARPSTQQFDYIYIAPPQYKGLWKRALETVDMNIDWLAEDAWVIVQIHPVEYQPLNKNSDPPLKHLFEFDQRRYGSTLLVFFERTISSFERSA